MGSIINFSKNPEPPELIWRCACGCQSFWIKEDSRAECQQCGDAPADEMGDWRTKLPAPPESAKEPEPGDMIVKIIDSPVLALKQTLAKADPEGSCFVAVAQKDGRVTVWGGVTEATEDQKAWVDGRLEDIRRMVIP